jgi:hypothetical protein
MRPTLPVVRLPHSHVDPNRLRSSSRPFLTAGTLSDRLGASAALFNESYLDSRLGHVFWGRLQGKLVEPFRKHLIQK